jgi:hypothetical protein
MRAQYKLLAEKYGTINATYPLNEDEDDMEFVNDIFKYIKGITLEEAEELVHFVDTTLRRINGFHPDGETITEIYREFVWVYGEENGLINPDDWNNPEDEEIAKKHIMQQFYNVSVGERKRQAALNKDNPGIEMDI